LSIGANTIFDHFLLFGLKMHIGRNDGKSKTEVVHFPASLQEELYTNNMNTRIPVSDGYITMNNKFKYLGSWVKDDLRGNHEVSV
jgi:hypothetical protein